MRQRQAKGATEHQEQAALIEWWNLWAKGLPFVLHAIPNGGARDAVTGAMLKREGVLAGVPDLFLAWPRNGYNGLYIELKRKHGGQVSQVQKDMLERLNACGYKAEVCKGWEEARDLIRDYALGGE